MKKGVFIFILSLTLLGLGCKKEQKGFVIKGTINTTDPIEEVSLRVVGDTTILASAKVIDGKFILKGAVKSPVLANLYFGKREYRNMVLENANYTVVANDDYKYIKGGKMNNTIFNYTWDKKYLQNNIDYNKTYKTAFKDIKRGDLEALTIARKKTVPYMKIRRSITNNHLRSIIQGDDSTLTKLYALYLNYDWDNYGSQKKLTLLDDYQKELGKNKFLIDYRNSILRGIANRKKQKETSTGKPFKDFTTQSISGKTMQLSEVVKKNKYTLVEFWASWCSPCRGSFPHLKKMYSKYKSKGFEVYGVSLDEKKDAFLKASKQEQIPWINTVDYKAFKSKAATDYAVLGIPYTVLIGQDGTIVGAGNDIRGLALEVKLKELLK